jgi:hypothetical protein
MGVKRFTGESECGFAERLVLRRMGVDELGDVLGECFPVHDE